MSRPASIASLVGAMNRSKVDGAAQIRNPSHDLAAHLPHKVEAVHTTSHPDSADFRPRDAGSLPTYIITPHRPPEWATIENPDHSGPVETWRRRAQGSQTVAGCVGRHRDGGWALGGGEPWIELKLEEVGRVCFRICGDPWRVWRGGWVPRVRGSARSAHAS
ncbi:uncharacterized protein BDZ99DRAFT_77320 [Mytilinidion resinicola]|uniref:Uncharacterized protein n=1 Tax=Mytilinidion resinicola TaxID=574789 RepID=A0A6A6YHA2_9PEZI|nr:uncharacterized protein BDZ99DRAFT_77320 [Mytilinidion resinicola]KAF2807277.1 hypothetical protein BDZ99DRAFT_77320 [Mytilinidion resinicola]